MQDFWYRSPCNSVSWRRLSIRDTVQLKASISPQLPTHPDCRGLRYYNSMRGTIKPEMMIHKVSARFTFCQGTYFMTVTSIINHFSDIRKAKCYVIKQILIMRRRGAATDWRWCPWATIVNAHRAFPKKYFCVHSM